MNSSSSQSDPLSGVEMNKFLDFLKITCQLNESIVNNGTSRNNPGDNIDYDKLANNEMINELLDQNPNNSVSRDTKEGGNASGEGETKNGIGVIDKKSDKCRRKSLGKSKLDFGCGKPAIHPALNEKLDEIISEGILDSVLPFICPPPCLTPTNGSNQTKHKCKTVTDSNSNSNVKLTTSHCDGAERRELPSDKAASSKSPRYNEGVPRIKDSTKASRRKSVGNSQANIEEKKGGE